MEFEFEQYIPADPAFETLLDEAFAKERATYTHNLGALHQIAALRAEGKEAVMLDSDDEEVEEQYTPEYMEYIGCAIDDFWQQTKKQLAEARTAQEQAAAVLGLAQEAFAGRVYTGHKPLLANFFGAVIADVAEYYGDSPRDSTALDEASGNVVRTCSTPFAFFQTVTQDMLNYAEMAEEAFEDIADLTEFYVKQHNLGGQGYEGYAPMPYDVVLNRYCAARGIDPNLLEAVSPEDHSEFIKKVQKFYERDMFAPFADILPAGGVIPEVAWFIGAAAAAVRIEEMEATLKQRSDYLHRPQPARTKKIQYMDGAANDQDAALPAGFLEAEIYRYHAPKIWVNEPDNDIGRSTLDLMRHPKALARMKEILAEVFEDWPQMAKNPGDLLAAKDYMTQVYLSADVETVPAMGR